MESARQLLESLVGETVFTVTRRQPNRILRLEHDQVVVATQKSPGGMKVPIQMVQDGLDQLNRSGHIRVDVQTLGHRSAFVGAVLSRLPNVEIETNPQRIRLR
jgi:hypothetical protein